MGIDTGLSEVDQALGDLSEQANEAKVRTRYDRIHQHAVAIEKENKPKQKPEGHGEERGEDLDMEEADPSLAPAEGDPEASKIFAEYETPLRWQTMQGDKVANVHGRADYTVWYEKQSVDPMALNLVVVEAKRSGRATSGIPQCVGYMSIVHKKREEAARNSVVFGFSTDGLQFCFIKIEKVAGQAVVSRSAWLDWRKRDQANLIYSSIRAIVRHAQRISPSHSRQGSGND